MAYFQRCSCAALRQSETPVRRHSRLKASSQCDVPGGASKSLAGAISEGLVAGPRLYQCGKALSQTGACTPRLRWQNAERYPIGGHADFGPANSSTGCCGGHTQSLGRTCDGVPQVLKATREELKGGADFIKVMCGGGVASPTVWPPMALIRNRTDGILSGCD